MQLVKEANGDVELAQRGIIFIDEIDKLAGVESDNTRDISGEGVQQSLLKMIEGSEMYLTPEKDKLFGSENIKIDTTNILFLVGGSFVGLEEIIEQRLNKKMVGFGAQRLSNDKKKNLLKYVTHEDLVKFGMIPEFMGRIQVLATLNKLEEEELIKILKEPKDALIKQYIELFKVDKIDLSFDDNAIKKIAHIAIKKKTGARGLKSIIENTMLDIMYSSPTNNVSNVVIKENDVIENSLMIE
jgi:ATP-dependent Clp protease ATP-binding subunit ClpX